MIDQIELQDIVEGESKYLKAESEIRLKEIISYEKQPYPKDKLKEIGEIFIYTLIVLLCKGGESYDSIIGLQKCGFGSWVFMGLHFLLSYLYTKSIAIRQYRLHA